MCEKASALEIGSDVTIQRKSLFEIIELILHSCNVNNMYIFRILYFSGWLYFFLMFYAYRELVIITLQFAYRNGFSRFFVFNHYNLRSNQPGHIDRMFPQNVYVMKKNLIISILKHLLNSI